MTGQKVDKLVIGNITFNLDEPEGRRLHKIAINGGEWADTVYKLWSLLFDIADGKAHGYTDKDTSVADKILSELNRILDDKFLDLNDAMLSIET